MGSPSAKLLQEILDDLKKQGTLKKEILDELKPRSRGAELWELSRHPIILLILGSLFGGWLSSCYQSREWNRQQLQLREKQIVEQKIATRDAFINAIIEAHAAAESAVRPMFYENSVTFAANEKDRVKTWDEASKNWQHARLKLTDQVERYFKNPEIKAKFLEIAALKNAKGNSLFVEVNNALSQARANPSLLNESEKSFEQQSQDYKDFKNTIRDNVFKLISEAMAKTRELRELMQAEIVTE